MRMTSLFNGQVYDLKWHPTANVFYKVIYDHEEKKEDTLKIAGMASRVADCSWLWPEAEWFLMSTLGEGSQKQGLCNLYKQPEVLKAEKDCLVECVQWAQGGVEGYE